MRRQANTMTIEPTAEIPRSVDADPRMGEIKRRQKDAKDRLVSERQHRNALVAERAELAASLVKALAGCGPTLKEEIDQRCSRLDAEIADANERVGQLESGWQQLETDTRAAIADIRAEIVEIHKRHVRDLIVALLARFDEVETLCAQLEDVRQCRFVSTPLTAAVIRGFMGKFRAEAKGYGVV